MFLNPNLLWLLVVPIGLTIYQVLKTSGTTARRNLITAGLRLLAMSMLVLALAQPVLTSGKRGKTVVAVIDCSDSMRPEDLKTASIELRSLVEKTGRRNVRLVIFGATAREVELENELLEVDGLAKFQFGEPGSNIGAALELASSLCAEDSNSALHLFSDGRETQGDMLKAADRMGRRKFKLVVHELGAVAEDSPLLLGVRAAGSVAVGESTPLTARIEALNPGDATVRVVDQDGIVVASRTASLRVGTQDVDVFMRPNKSGRRTYRISLDGSSQMLDVGLTVVNTVVGVVESAPGTPAAVTLRSLLGPNAKIQSLKAADLKGGTWDEIDVLVLADTPADEIPEATQKELQSWVEQGGGLLVAGGRNAFGPGGYARCKFADALPLRFPQKKEVRDPSTALAILIDTSVSMRESGVNLAKEIARLALKRLKPHDKAGIVEFYGTKRWAAPMQSAANHIGLQRALNRLSAGGGTQLLPGLTEAYYGLVNVNTRTKHILLLTDGGVERGAYGPLINRMVEDGIHLSTVTVGPRASSTFLAQLARQGRGQFYTAPNRFKLPEIIVKQPSSSLLNPFVEKPVRLTSISASRLVKDLDFETAPALQGYVRATPRKTAEVLLRSEVGDPVLARWNYGLGRVATFTTQIGGEWAGDFVSWPAMPDLMANMVRQLRGVSPKKQLAITLSSRSPGLVVDVRALSAAPALTMKGLSVDVSDASGEVLTARKLIPVLGNVWQTTFSGLPAGRYVVTVSNYAGDKSMGSDTVVIPPPNEFTRIGPDGEKLATAVRISSDSAAQVDSATPLEWRELWPIFVVSSLLCFLLMILARRLPLRSGTKGPATAKQLALVAAIGLSTMTYDLSAEEPLNLSASEMQTIDKILLMKPDEARVTMKEACRGMAERHGDLRKVIEYLASKKKSQTMVQLFALVALENGNLRSAVGTLKNLVAHDPGDLWAVTQLARVHDMQGKTSDALGLLDGCLASAKDPATRFALLVRRLQLHYSENQLDAARGDIREILKQPDFDRPDVRNYCARIAGLWGDFSTVEELFVPVGEGRALMRDLLYFGQILLRRGKAQKARDVFAKALTVATARNDRRYVLDRLVTASREAGALEGLMNGWRRDANLQPEQLTIMVGVLSGELNRVKDVLPVLDRTDLPDKTKKVIESPEFQTRLLMELLAAGHSDLVHRKYKALIAKYSRNYFLHEGYVRLLLTEGRRAEAIEFLQKTIASEQKFGGLMHLAKSARSLSLHHLAITAAEKAAVTDTSAYVQAKIFVVEQRRLTGDGDGALKLLQKVEGETAGDPKMVGLLAEAYEKNGRPKDSIRLYRAAYDKTKDEGLLKRLLAIDEVNRQPDKGFALWRELWEIASEQATIVQAQDRILALGAETGVLADIAIEFEERLDEGQLSERELTMLLEIYTSANDPVSAADILMELARKNDADIVETYRKMVRVYMECELFGRCTAILRKLIKRDPENRDDYLRSLALIALERQSKGDAAAVLSELADRSGDGVLKDSFSAGVLGMIGRRREAAQAYRRALAANPNEAESWLLWANAQKALGKTGREQAIGRLSLLMEESDDNDLFTIAVDGLLNVGASRSVLGAALRRVYERIANQPHKRFLYRLAADLNDELRRNQDAGRILEQSLAITDEGREVVLRELMAIARMRNSMDDVVRHSRSLLNTARGVPPDECLELGSVLLAKGHVSEADNAFLRITAEGDTRNMARDIVQRYESAGYYKKAAKLIRELVLGNPQNLDLILRKAIIEEKVGNYDVASRIYLDSFERLTSKIQGLKKGGRWSQPITRSGPLNAVVDGLLLSARTKESRKRVLAAIRKLYHAELKRLEEKGTVGESIGENPRLAKLAETVHRMAVVFHDRESFDSVAADMAKRYAASPRTEWQLASLYGNWGLRRRQNQPVRFPADVSAFMHDPAKLDEAFSKVLMSSNSMESLLALAARLGCDRVLGKMQAEANLTEIRKIDGELLASVGVASGDPKFLRRVLFETLSPTRSAYRQPVEKVLQKQIAVAWHKLNPAERRSVANQYTLKVKKRSQWHNPEGQILYLKCMAGSGSEIDFSMLRNEVGKSTGIDVSTLNKYLKAQRLNGSLGPHAWAAFTRWWLDMPEAELPKALNQLVKGMEPGARECVLAQFAMLLDDEQVDDELLGEFKKLFQGGQISSLSSETRHMARPVFLALSGYNENRLIDHIRKTMADGVAGETALRLLAGGTTVANDRRLVQRAWKAIDAGKEQVTVDPRATLLLHSFVLQPLANALSKEQLDEMLSRFSASNDPLDTLIQFLLLRHAGRDMEALDVLARIRSLQVEDSRVALVREILPAILASYGWDAYAPQFIGSGGDPHLSGKLLPYSLYDPISLLAHAGAGLIESTSRRILVGEMMQDSSMVREAGRLYLADTRHPATGRIRSLPPRIARKTGGLQGIDARRSGSVLEALSDSQAGVWEAYNWLSAHHPRGGSSAVRTALENVLKQGIARHGVPAELKDELDRAAGESMLNTVDRGVITTIAQHAPKQLPKHLGEETSELMLSGGARLCTYWKTVGLDQYALSLTRWALASDIVNKGTSAWLAQYLELLPKSERLETMRALLPLMGLNGIRLSSGGDEAVLFDTLLDLGMKSELGQLLDRYLLVLGQPSSDGKFQDDIAIALARINRLDDYRRIVRRRIFSEQHRKRGQYCNSPVVLHADDYTGSLPEPDQVADIGRCIDIHRETHAWLRTRGVISRETEVAQVCILGRWCADRGLKKRAEELLRTAETLAEGMLTGRLWVADLHRRLGNEKPAATIERELLRRDLLPVARIPDVLKAVAAKDGQAKADSLAYRISDYSNHPELLPLALRHARTAGLTKKASDLSLRIQKLKRLGLQRPSLDHQAQPEAPVTK